MKKKKAKGDHDGLSLEKRKAIKKSTKKTPKKKSNELSKKELTELVIARKKKEVPFYHPKTGEVNLDYEKITGKKNPLLEYETISTNRSRMYADPANLTKVTTSYEPKKQNRWTVNFPEEFGIQPWMFAKTNRPRVYTSDIKLMYHDIVLTLHDPIGYSVGDSLMKIIGDSKPFNYTLDILDPKNDVVEQWLISGCVIKYIDFGELDYTKDGICDITIIVRPSDVKLVNNK